MMNFSPQLPIISHLLTLNIFSAALCSLHAQEQELSLRSADGSREAKFVLIDLDRQGVDLRAAGGQLMQDVSLDAFDEGSQALLLEKAAGLRPKPPLGGANGKVDAEALNEIFGVELFRNRSLFDELPELVAQRLEWPMEGESRFSSSYRAYFRQGKEMLGAHSWTASMLTEEGQIRRVSLVFANRGDAFQAAGSGQDHFQSGQANKTGKEKFFEQLELDKKTVEESLSSLLGESERQSFGDGEGRTKVLRWDWLDHALLLVKHEEAMVQLLIVPHDFADATGKVKRVPDRIVEERIAQCVARRDNGDVIIDQIPMVDQGPKGYCVPATMERVLRYMSVPADMYEIAVLGQSGFGGGTSMNALIEGLKRDIRWGGRGLRFSREEELTMKEIREQVDQGVPLLWLLSSTEDYNRLSNQLTKKRNQMMETQWEEYSSFLGEQAEGGVKLPRGMGNNHIVLIIGYNEETGEIATSDSWGPAFRERWIPLAEAKQVSHGAPFWIEP